MIAFMIEKKSAMDDLENILNVKGVSMVQFGPNDYSVTVGTPGIETPKVQNAHIDMIKMALRKGIAPRVEILSHDDAKPFINWECVTSAWVGIPWSYPNGVKRRRRVYGNYSLEK